MSSTARGKAVTSPDALPHRWVGPISFRTIRSGANRTAQGPTPEAAGIVDRVAAVTFDGGQARLLQQAVGSLGLSVEAWIAVLVVDTGSPRD